MPAIPLSFLYPQGDPVASGVQIRMGHQFSLIVHAVSKVPEIGVIVETGQIGIGPVKGHLNARCNGIGTFNDRLLGQLDGKGFDSCGFK